jgi:dipeptidyl aminopeptidase/acylaminoacyl peptidase
LLLLIHGGPQGAWGEAWSYRWNPQVFAAAGFVVFMPNPRGSTGYGQSFIDGIRGDWGGQVYLDIMAGVDYVSRRPYIDSGRMAAAGASYGGYMINWMLGHTDRFRAFVSHAGVYDLESMFGATEELWFPLWEFQGTPWDNPEMYERWSPSKYVANFKTPTLVVHGEKDYRVPATQGMQLFTALQTRNVPSRFLYFPDEGHWILKPRNSLYWHQTVIDWLKNWVERGSAPAATPAPVTSLDAPPAVTAGEPAPGIQIDRGPQPQ